MSVSSSFILGVQLSFCLFRSGVRWPEVSCLSGVLVAGMSCLSGVLVADVSGEYISGRGGELEQSAVNSVLS